MKKRDLFKAQKAVKQIANEMDIEKDYRRRQKTGSEYRPQDKDKDEPTPPSKVEIIPPVATSQPNNQQQPQIVLHQHFNQPKSGKSKTCLIIAVTSLVTVLCLCGGVLMLPALIGEPPGQPVAGFDANPPATARPNNQTAAGMAIVGVKLTPYVSQLPNQPGPGNWWRVETSFYNGGNKPLTISGYNIVLRDQQGKEYWYDRNLSMFNPEGKLVDQVNPGVTTVVTAVFNLPNTLNNVSLVYDGAVVPIRPNDIVN